MPGRLTADTDKPNYSAILAEAYPLLDWENTALIVSLGYYEISTDNASAAADFISTGGNSVMPGWRFTATAAGSLDFTIYADGAAYSGTTVGSIHGTAPHFVDLIFDGVTDTYSIYVDGVAVKTMDPLPGAAAALNAQGQLGNLTLGTPASAAAAYAAPGRYRDIRVLHIPGGAPANLTALLNKMRRNRYLPITAGDIAT